MPLLDVSDVLSDPDFCQAVTVVRSTQSPPAGGFTQIATATFSITAVVQPANSRDLQRMLDAERTGGGIVLYAACGQASVPVGQPPIQDDDVVTVLGADYTAVGVDDWSAYGGGYVRAVMAKSDLP